uniref:Uncharacterized protein LOC111103274 isoform X1 n=1 Tax=Crassostrea virginica TaxID=6565 RepID=A0A8B8ANA6_CRAVI|nr:uncharacterized protein LOC111103274 isoform X1 [Crassostrea virginica]
MWHLRADFVYKRLAVLCLFFFGQSFLTFSSAEACVWSNWTELTGNDSIQHRLRICGGNLTIESRNCDYDPCNGSAKQGENSSMEIPVANNESTPVEYSTDTLSLHKSTSPDTNNSTAIPLGVSTNGSNSTNVLNASFPSTKKYHANLTEPFDHTRVDSKTPTEKKPFHASTTMISILTTYLKTTLNGANNSALILGYNSNTTGVPGTGACKHGKDPDDSGIDMQGLGFVTQTVLITVLVCLLVIAVVAFWCERQKRLKHERERAYIFSLPSNTELTATRESNFHYSSMLEFARLFDESRAERLSSCVYQDITDLVSSEFPSPRSTYQQIPFRDSQNSLSEIGKGCPI